MEKRVCDREVRMSIPLGMFAISSFENVKLPVSIRVFFGWTSKGALQAGAPFYSGISTGDEKAAIHETTSPINWSLVDGRKRNLAEAIFLGIFLKNFFTPDLQNKKQFRT